MPIKNSLLQPEKSNPLADLEAQEMVESAAGGVEFVAEDMSAALRELTEDRSTTGSLLTNLEYITVYHPETGDQVVLPIQYKGLLIKKFPKSYANPKLLGRNVFTTKQMVKPRLGNLMCRLHPDHPNRAWIESVGLGHIECFTEGFPNEWEVNNHMLSKHIKEGDHVLKQEQKEEREKNQADQMAMLGVIKSLAERMNATQ